MATTTSTLSQARCLNAMHSAELMSSALQELRGIKVQRIPSLQAHHRHMWIPTLAPLDIQVPRNLQQVPALRLSTWTLSLGLLDIPVHHNMQHRYQCRCFSLW